VVLVWDENGKHVPPEVHPDGIRGTIAEGLAEAGIDHLVRHLDEPSAGLDAPTLNQATVLIWWGHARHNEVPEEVALEIAERVRRGDLGLLILHSGHQSRVAEAIFGNRVYSKGGYDDDLQVEHVRVCAPEHPICAGVEDFAIEDEEFYGAPATFPQAEVILLQSLFPRYGRYYPSGLCWTVGEGKRQIERSGPGKGEWEGEGAGRVAYLRFGHETSRSLAAPPVRKLIVNAVKWLSSPLPFF
jgi:trehalose utilization protein